MAISLGRYVWISSDTGETEDDEVQGANSLFFKRSNDLSYLL